MADTNEVDLLDLFDAKTQRADIAPYAKPTLSPDDPNFEAWWEEHKSEWED